jgi:hypothetical protein
MVTTAIDHARRRLSLSESQLEALRLIAIARNETTDAAASAWMSLDEAGIAHDGRLPGWVVEVGAVLAEPGIHLVVELLATGEPEIHQVWVRPERSVVGHTDADHTVLRCYETALVPMELLRLVELGPRPTGAADQPIAIDATVLDHATTAAQNGGHEPAEQILSRAGHDPSTARTLAKLLTERRLSWRVTAVWRTTEDTLTHDQLLAIDSGEQGIWLVDIDPEGPVVRLHPTPPSQVWRRLLSLLPSPDASVDR